MQKAKGHQKYNSNTSDIVHESKLMTAMAVSCFQLHDLSKMMAMASVVTTAMRESRLGGSHTSVGWCHDESILSNTW